MPYLIYGDAPRYSRALNSWPQYARLGGVFIGAGGGGRRRLKVPDREKEIINRRRMILRDDNDLLNIIVLALKNDILN